MSSPGGPVVLITGASSGLGLAVAEEYARRGGHLVLVARGVAALQEVGDRCAVLGAASVQVVPGDVRDQEAMHAVVRGTVERHDRIDVVVNSAGVIASGPALEVPVDVYDAVIETNLVGSMNVVRAVLPVLLEQRSGALVLVGSLLGHITVPYASAYVVSKWGVRGLARQLRTELRGTGVRLGYVAPGAVDTPIYHEAADYLGWALRPPPPVAPPSRIARQVVAIAEGRRVRLDLSVVNEATNQAMRAAFQLMPPPVYDTVVRLVLAVTAVEQGERTKPHDGNVIAPDHLHAERHHGGGPSVTAIARNLAAIWSRRVSTER